MLQRILLGIGGTPFTPVASGYAVELCRLHGAELTAVTVVDRRRLEHVGVAPIGAGGADPHWREQRVAVAHEHVVEAVDSLRKQCDEQGVRLVVDHEEGEPFDLMVDRAKYHDLSIFGLRSMFEHDVLGGDDIDPASMLQRMVEAGVRPLLAVADEFRPIRKALVAFGGSIRAAETMRHFVQMKPWPEVELRLIYCGGDEATARRDLSDAQSYCRAYGFDVGTIHRPGHAAEEILNETEEWDADLIVIGSHTKGIIRSAVLGDTALYLIRHADRPLFIDR